MNNETKLLTAAEKGNLADVEHLINGGADKNAADKTGRTALYLAAKDNHADVVSFLLKAGASMDKANSNRWTPLMQASQRGHTSIVRLLVAAGADGTLRNNENHTALDKAANTEIRDILKSPYATYMSAAGKVSAAAVPPAFEALRAECAHLLRQAAEAPQRWSINLQISKNLAKCRASGDVNEVLEVAEQNRKLLDEVRDLTVSVAECHTLKQRLGAFDHRLLQFLKDQMQDPESIPDAAVLAAVGGMRSAVKLAIDTAFLPDKASAAARNTFSERNSTTVRESAAERISISLQRQKKAAESAEYFHHAPTGRTPILDVMPLFKDSATELSAPSARRMLRGRIESRDDFGKLREVGCVIKSAVAEGGDIVSPAAISMLKKEREMYTEMKRLAEIKNAGNTGCVMLLSAHPDYMYLVLQVHGCDLRNQLQTGLRNPQPVLEGVVSAVMALHSLGIMHGDIKPQNLLYLYNSLGDCKVKLCDLDCAAIVGRSVPSASLGTEHYLAPELRAAKARSNPILAALQLDMFALGLVMWQVLNRNPQAALDCEDADKLYSDQAELNEHLDFPPLYKTHLQKVLSLNPAHRMNVADLYHFIKNLSASCAQQKLVETKEDLADIREGVHTANSKLNMVAGAVAPLGGMMKSIKEDLGAIAFDIQELREDFVNSAETLNERFDALSGSAREIAETLRRETVLNGEQAKLLPELIRAAHAALQGLTDVSHHQQTEQSPAEVSAQIEGHMSIMQTAVEAAVSRALAAQKEDNAQELGKLASALQAQFKDLSGELTAQLLELHESERTSGELFGTLELTNQCLSRKLEEILVSLGGIQRDMKELKDNQVALGRQVGQVLTKETELSAMVQTLIAGTHGIPTLAVVLPVVSTGWTQLAFPMRLLRNQYRLYFLCAHTHQIAPCGPKGKGYKINVTKQWVLDAAPVLRVGLVLLKVALLASGLPLPIPDLCSVLVESGLYGKYLSAALQLVTNPPADDELAAEFPLSKLDSVQDYEKADLLRDQGGVDAQKQLQEGSRTSYRVIKALLEKDGVDLPSTCGLRQVTHRGKTAWVLDNDATEQAWRAAMDSAAP